LKFAIFITSGIGNALYLVPLIKTLRQRGSVTCIAASPFRSEQVFDGFAAPVFDRVIHINSPAAWPELARKMVSPFDTVYLDFFASTRKHLALAHFLGKTVVTNHVPESLPAFFRRKIHRVEPVIGLHEGTQYLRYANEALTDADLSESLFQLDPHPAKKVIEGKYITVQPGTGNNKAPWKTWPMASWKALIGRFGQAFPGYTIVVLGDKSEAFLAKEFETIGPQVYSLIGKTTLQELPSIVTNATLHIGGDSALLHIAGCVGTPTVTICGGSDPQIFGWHKIDQRKHRLVKHTIACHPCYRWIAPNTSRVRDPLLCPDFKCIRSIDETEVFRAVSDQLTPANDAE